MKHCIWCSKKEPYVTFNKEAHTFPKSLGGKSICGKVCDICNSFFGSRTPHSPSVEIALKEVLNLSKFILLNGINKIPKNTRHKSEYFNFNLNSQTIRLKPKYSLKGNMQEKLGRLFRRGLYKVFLEERECQRNDAHDERFNFIRSFARFDFDDYPIYYFKPKLGIIYFSEIDVLNPMIRFTDYSDELDKEFRVFEYQIMGHYFCIPTSKSFTNLCLTNYQKHLEKEDGPFGKELVQIRYVEDIDFRFKYMNDN